MDYEAPAVDVLGAASELVQASFGPRYDGDGYQFSQGFLSTPLEEE